MLCWWSAAAALQADLPADSRNTSSGPLPHFSENRVAFDWTHHKLSLITLWERWLYWRTQSGWQILVYWLLIWLNPIKIGTRRSNSPHWSGNGWAGCQHEVIVEKQQWNSEVLFHTCLANWPQTDGLRPLDLPGRDHPQKKQLVTDGNVL